MNTRACMDCEHVRVLPERGPVCMRFGKEFMRNFDPVYGAQMSLSAPDCKVARGERGQCGMLGRAWKPRVGTDAYYEQQRETQEAKDRAAREIIGSPPPPDTKPWWRRFLEGLA